MFAIFFPAWGVHKFILGYHIEGAIYVLSLVICGIGGLFTCGLLWFLYFVLIGISFIEGIIYLSKTDVEFDQTYVYNRRPWF